jgi:hypothetical protein
MIGKGGYREQSDKGRGRGTRPATRARDGGAIWPECQGNQRLRS